MLSLQEGDYVYALGAPKGLELSFTNGIVSSFRNTNGQFLIQNTAPIAPGSSGGPLFDRTGRVVGVTTSLLEDASGIYFSVGIGDLKRLIRTPQGAALLFSEWAKQRNSRPSPPAAANPNGPNEAAPGDAGRGSPTNAAPSHSQNGRVATPPTTDAPVAAAKTNPSDRDYYQQLHDAGGFSKGLPNAVCFSDDTHSGTFFTFVAYAYDKDYYDAQAKLPTFEQAQAAGFPKVTPGEMTQFDIMERVQRTAPYVTFLMKGWFESFPPEAQQFFRSGGRVLDETVYEKGVKINTIEYRWDGSSWFTSRPPADPNAYSRTSKTLHLSIEPTTMRYVDSTTVTVTVGKGETAATDTRHYGPWGGVCEKVPNPK